MTSITRITRPLTLLLLLAGCGGGGSGGGGDPPPTALAPPAESVAGLRCSAAGQRGWCWQAPQPWGHLIRDVQFTSATQGWAVGDAGAMLRTSDGGVTWQEQFMPEGAGLQAIRFADADNGWLLGTDGGRLWRTRDGGRTWLPGGSPPLDFAGELRVAGAQRLVVTGTTRSNPFDWRSVVSEDGGSTWQASALPVTHQEADGTLWGRSGEGPVQSLDGGRSFSPPAAWAGAGVAGSFDVAGDGFAWASLSRWDSALGDFTAPRLLQRPGRGAAWSDAAPPPLPAGHRMLGIGLFSAGGWVQSGKDTPLDYGFWHTGGGTSTWARTLLPPGISAEAVTSSAFIDGSTMWLQAYVGARPSYLTSDGGRSWVGDIGQPAGTADAIRFIRRDGGGGLLMGYGGDDRSGATERWYRSRDQGRSWLPMPGLHAPDQPVTGLWMIDGRRGVATTAAGTLLTENGGHDWSAPAGVPSGADVQGAADLQFTPDGTGWLVAGGRVRRSTDGGRTWTAVEAQPPWSGSVGNLRFVDDSNGFASATTTCSFFKVTICRVQLYRTENKGLSWRAVGPETSQFTGTAMLNPTLGVRWDGEGIATTTDGGQTWAAAQIDGNTTPVGGRLVAAGGTLWLLGADSLLRSTDSGRRWSPVALPVVPGRNGFGTEPTLRMNDIAFADASHGWIVGNEGLVLATSDGGLTWSRQASGTQMDLVRVFARSADAAWIGGRYGSILATASGGR